MGVHKEFLIAIKRLRYISRRIRNATGDQNILLGYQRFSERRTIQDSFKVLKACLLDETLCQRVAAIGMIRVDLLGYEPSYEMSRSRSGPGELRWNEHFHGLRVQLDTTRIQEYLEGFDVILDQSSRKMEGRLALFKLGLT